jgi:hypothetical protein
LFVCLFGHCHGGARCFAFIGQTTFLNSFFNSFFFLIITVNDYSSTNSTTTDQEGLHWNALQNSFEAAAGLKGKLAPFFEQLNAQVCRMLGESAGMHVPPRPPPAAAMPTLSLSASPLLVGDLEVEAEPAEPAAKRLKMPGAFSFAAAVDSSWMEPQPPEPHELEDDERPQPDCSPLMEPEMPALIEPGPPTALQKQLNAMPILAAPPPSAPPVAVLQAQRTLDLYAARAKINSKALAPPALPVPCTCAPSHARIMRRNSRGTKTGTAVAVAVELVWGRKPPGGRFRVSWKDWDTPTTASTQDVLDANQGTFPALVVDWVEDALLSISSDSLYQKLEAWWEAERLQLGLREELGGEGLPLSTLY